jgi:hypothetical protein
MRHSNTSARSGTGFAARLFGRRSLRFRESPQIAAADCPLVGAQRPAVLRDTELQHSVPLVFARGTAGAVVRRVHVRQEARATGYPSEVRSAREQGGLVRVVPYFSGHAVTSANRVCVHGRPSRNTSGKSTLIGHPSIPTTCGPGSTTAYLPNQVEWFSFAHCNLRRRDIAAARYSAFELRKLRRRIVNRSFRPLCVR